MKEKRSLISLFISILIIIIGAIVSSCVMTSGYTVSVQSVTIPTEDGQWSTADIYKPDSATKETKASCVVVVPGFQRSKEAQAAYSIELARRGFVVITLDPYAQGDSSASTSAQAATVYGYGLYAWIDYITATDNLNYIDKDKVGAVGHSAGGNACVKAAGYFGQEVVDGIESESRLKAVYISGYVRSFTASDLANIRCNMGMSYAYYDEGAYQNETQQAKDNGTWIWGDDIANGDMQYAPESIRFVNSGLKLAGQSEIETVEIGKIYGNQFEGTLRIVNNEKIIHALQPYDNTSIANMIDYFELAFDLNFEIASTNQVWLIKEVAQGFMLVSLFVLILALASLLLKNEAFKSLVHEKPEKKNQTNLEKIFFWCTFAISAVIACFDFIPCAKLAQKWFPVAQSSAMTWVFPQRMTNAVLLWAVINGLIGIALFFGSHYLKKWITKLQTQKNNSLDDSEVKEIDNTFDPIKIGGRELLKTFALALLLFATFYMIILIVYIIFHVDFRFLFISARPILLSKMLVVSLMYIPLFFIFYFSNSLKVCCSMRVKNWPNWLSYLISVLGNSIGLVGIMLIQYICFINTGLVNYTTEWLYCNLLFGLIPMMMLLPLLNRFFYEKTGKAYLGPMVTCMIFIFMTLTNTVCYIPL